MTLLILGLSIFIGVHLVPTQMNARAGGVTRFGEGGYKGLFSLVAFLGLALIIYGFGQARSAAERQSSALGCRRAGRATRRWH